MTQTSTVDNKRIAKNTILLYIRMIIIMALALYTSRIILNQLGVEDFGIYNVVGGVVAMFSVISSALSSSISRYITFELGRRDSHRLNLIFSTSVNIQIIIALLVFVLGEIVGVWFLNNKMTVPEERLFAANCVLQFSLLSFCINIISVPYNACIIAHEHMSAFAYITVLEAVLKLVICFLLVKAPIDRLIFYALLMLIVAIIIRFIYAIYCKRHFDECRYKFLIEKGLSIDMLKFAGLNFFINGAYVFNNQGINILINIFFGVTLNAARGIALQVESAVVQFVNNFTTAVNPQITKSYAAGDFENMFTLVCRGAKFSYFLLLIIALPILIETDYILTIWLKSVPEYAVIFVRLSIIGALVTIIGNTGYTACMATGNIKNYVIWISIVGSLVFPITWIFYILGYPPQSTYFVFILVYVVVDIVRLFIMKSLLKFPFSMFAKYVICPIAIVTVVAVVAVIIPLFLYNMIETPLDRFITVVFSCIVSTVCSIYFIGLTVEEKDRIKRYLSKFFKRILLS